MFTTSARDVMKKLETVMLREKKNCGKGQIGYANVKLCAKLL